jgi:cell division protein FtsW (lipid II flippase)
VEVIKVLLVLFMAGYFTAKWERLRELREKRLVPGVLRWLNLPRFSQALPVMCGVACALAMFFLLKDLGPALVTGFLFMVMFGVARGRAGLALMGLALLVGGVSIGYRLGQPATVVSRVSMWLSPWDNDVQGGDQLAHSIWALSTGGLWGSGPGWGDPALIPAGCCVRSWRTVRFVSRARRRMSMDCFWPLDWRAFLRSKCCLFRAAC